MELIDQFNSFLLLASHPHKETLAIDNYTGEAHIACKDSKQINELPLSSDEWNNLSSTIDTMEKWQFIAREDFDKSAYQPCTSLIMATCWVEWNEDIHGQRTTENQLRWEAKIKGV